MTLRAVAGLVAGLTAGAALGQDRRSLAGGRPGVLLAMPRDYGRRLSAGELPALVAFLLATTRR